MVRFKLVLDENTQEPKQVSQFHYGSIQIVTNSAPSVTTVDMSQFHYGSIQISLKGNCDIRF